MSSLTIATVNVNGIRAACKKRNDDNLGMNEWLRQTPADIVLFQEVRATPAQAEKALGPSLDAGWHLVVADAVEEGMKGRAGVGILSRTPIDNVAVGFDSDVTRFRESGRWIEADTGGIRVASLYLPSGDEGTKKLDDKYAFLEEFSDVLRARADAYPDMVIGGDWNICHRAQDLKNNRPNEKVSGHLPEERAFMDSVFGAFPDAVAQEKKGLGEWRGTVDYAPQHTWEPTTEPRWFDVGRRLNPDPELRGPYTWWTYRGQAFNNDAGWRLDYQAATKNMLDRAQRSWVDKAPSVRQRWSDHSPMVVEYGG